MENNGILFEEEKGLNSFTIEIEGGGLEYLSTVKTLLRMLGNAEEGLMDQSERMNVCNLIAGMLPSEEQIEMLSSYSPLSIRNLESDNEELERENGQLKKLMELREVLINDKERTIRELTKTKNVTV